VGGLCIIAISVVLHITRLDIHCLGRLLMKWQFKVVVHTMYYALWMWVLFTFFSSTGYERGLWLMIASFEIAPISEMLHLILLLLIDYIFQIEHQMKIGTPLFCIDLFFSIVFSFVTLEFLLRIAKRKLTAQALKCSK
jgi:hypothetical protein